MVSFNNKGCEKLMVAWIEQCRDWIGKKTDIVLDKIHEVLDNYDAVLEEGTYGKKKNTVLEKIFNRKSKDLDNATHVASSILSTTSYEMLKRVFILGALVLVADKALIVGLIALGGLGIFKCHEYYQHKKSRYEIIQDRNHFGQLVEGSRMDLCRLRRAQERMISIEDHMPEGALKTTDELRTEIARSVEKEMSRVRVIDAGDKGADINHYDFRKPRHEGVYLPPDILPARIDKANIGTSCAWEKGMAAPAFETACAPAVLSPEQIVEQLVSIQKSLSPELQKAVADKMTAGVKLHS